MNTHPTEHPTSEPAGDPSDTAPDEPGLRRSLLARAAMVGRCIGAVGTVAVGVDQFVDPMPTAAAAAGVAATVAVGRVHGRWLKRTGRIPADADADPLGHARDQAGRLGGGAFIGLDASDERAGIVHAPAETAVLVLGPPRRGKSSGVIIPSVLTAPGAVVSTSTKPDVLSATAASRSEFGAIWLYDPTGQIPLSELPDGVRRLRWSPLDSARDWAAARRLAQAMVGASPAAKGTRHEGHWTSRAAALLAPMLYAASGARMQIADVVAWVLAGDTEIPTMVLNTIAEQGDPDADIALQVLRGVEHAADQERQSIWSTTADVIDVYTTHEALAAASNSNWQPAAFVDSADTIYIAASAEHQRAVAPLVVALLEAVRNAQYARHRANALAKLDQGAPVTLALDEVANVAPIESLPALVSEAGGQGLHVIAAVQDLSQLRGRWGAEVADGFLSLFQHVLVLGGVRDTRTLEAISTICGDYDRTQTTRTKTRSRATFKPWQLGSTSIAHGINTQRQRRLDAGDVYALEDGTALHLHGSGWRPIRLAAHYAHPRWRRVLAAAPDRLHTHGPDDEPRDGRREPDVRSDGHGPVRVPTGMTSHPSRHPSQGRGHRTARPTPQRNREPTSQAARDQQESLRPRPWRRRVMNSHLDPTPQPRFVAPVDDSWRDDAACLTADPEMFFPEPADHASAAAAVAVCNTCPVTDACLRDALETGEQHGIRGGLTPRHRARLRTDRRPDIHRTARDHHRTNRQRAATT